MADKCMLVAAACYNLKKLLNFKVPKVNAGVMKLLKRAEIELQNSLPSLFAAVTIPDGWYNKKSALQLK
jgi:hypothetical protein